MRPTILFLLLTILFVPGLIFLFLLLAFEPVYVAACTAVIAPLLAFFIVMNVQSFRARRRGTGRRPLR